MLVLLTEYLIQFYDGFHIFLSPSFRAIVSLLTSFCLSILIGPLLITSLKKLQIGEVIRQNGPKSHFVKRGTPTMGGLMMLMSIIISVCMWTCLVHSYVWYVLFVLVSYAIVGFIDDYRKVVRKNSHGLIARFKYFYQSVIAIVVLFAIFSLDKENVATQLVIPFCKNFLLNLESWYVLLAYFVIVGTSNAVNLTDGMDGLAIVPTMCVSAGLALIALMTGNINFSDYLHIPYIGFAGELAVICMSIVGAGLGFLWFNAYPAQIFMGEVGALALGGALGTIAVLLRQEFCLLIMGGVFVIETLSVFLQVSLFKLRGKRIFRMAPIHHHYELIGWPEPRIIVRFWIISIISVIIGLAILKVRSL